MTRVSDLNPAIIANLADLYMVVQSGQSRKQTLAQMRAAIADALALTGNPTAPTPAAPTTNVSTSVANMAAIQAVLAAIGFDNITLAQTGVNPDNQLPTSINAVVSSNPGTYPAGFSGGGTLITGRRNITPYRAIEILIGEAAGRIWVRTNFATWGAWVEITRGGSDATITTMTALTSVTSALALALPNRVAQYTLATLPSAATYNAYEIDVTNATGGPKRCRSNGTVWQILNTTTTVS